MPVKADWPVVNELTGPSQWYYSTGNQNFLVGNHHSDVLKEINFIMFVGFQITIVISTKDALKLEAYGPHHSSNKHYQ